MKSHTLFINGKVDGKHGALELSIGTIVIIVLGVAMLIMGLVLTRSIMCGALGLTGDVNSKVRAELNTIFDTTEGEVACIGSREAAKIVPSRENFIHCAIRAPETAEYASRITDYGSSIESLPKERIQSLITTSVWKGKISPGEKDPVKPVRIKLPSNAPEGNIRIQLEFTRNGQHLTTKDLDLEITRVGVIRSAAC